MVVVIDRSGNSQKDQTRGQAQSGLGMAAGYKVRRTFVDFGDDPSPASGRGRIMSDPCYRYDSDAGSTRSAESIIDEAESFSDSGASQHHTASAPKPAAPEPAAPEPAQEVGAYQPMTNSALCGAPTPAAASGASPMMWVPVAVPTPTGVAPMWMMMPCMGVDPSLSMAACEAEYQMSMLMMQQMQLQQQAQQAQQQQGGALGPAGPRQEQMQPPSPRNQRATTEAHTSHKAQAKAAVSPQGAPAQLAADAVASQDELSLAIAKARAPWRKGNKAQVDEEPHTTVAEAAEEADDRTTLMLRNLPNDLTRNMLIDLLEAEGLARTFDFLYVPADFGRGAGLGYAFVNFVSNAEAMRAWQHLKGFTSWGMRSAKVLEVSWAAPLQGLEAYVDRYRNSPVMHERVPEQFKPLLFVGGRRRPLPSPTKALRAPEPERRRAPVWGGQGCLAGAGEWWLKRPRV